MMWYGMENLFGPLEWVVQTVTPPKLSLTLTLLTGAAKLCKGSSAITEALVCCEHWFGHKSLAQQIILKKITPSQTHVVQQNSKNICAVWKLGGGFYV